MMDRVWIANRSETFQVRTRKSLENTISVSIKKIGILNYQ